MPAAAQSDDTEGTEAANPGAGVAAAPAQQPSRIGVATRRLHVTLGGRVKVAGSLRPGAAGVPVRLQVRRAGSWRTVDRGRTRAGGRYTLAKRFGTTVSAPARVLAGNGAARSRRTVGRINVYRVANASWYGPGLYGGHLGCGGTLDAGDLGVAHKTLPCGTRVTLRHKGRTVRVRVIDRGPYVGGREYDLTAATAQRLRFRGHGAILVAD